MATQETLAKLNRILDGLMGVSLGLEFQALDELSADSWDPGDLRRLRANSDEVFQYLEDGTGTAFGFPVRAEDRIFGLAIIRGWKGARPRQLVLMSELIASVFESQLGDEMKRDQLRTLEERMMLSNNKPSNVIALRPAKFGKVLSLTEAELPEPAQTSVLTSLPLLIRTKRDFPLHRVAVDIHQMSNRWALLNLADLPENVLDSRESLKDLGAITLFIKDLTALSISQQVRLAEYLAIRPGTDLPFIVAGLPEDVSRESSSVLPHLMDQFSHSRLDWTERSIDEISRVFISASLEHMLETARESLTHGEYYLPFHLQQLDPNHPTSH